MKNQPTFLAGEKRSEDRTQKRSVKLKEAGRGIVNRVHADPRRRELAGSWLTVAVVVLQLGAGCAVAAPKDACGRAVVLTAPCVAVWAHF